LFLSDIKIKQDKEKEEKEKKDIVKLSDIKIESEKEKKSNFFLDLNNRIIEAYNNFNTVQQEIQESQNALQQSPTILKPSYMAIVEAKKDEGQKLQAELNASIKERDNILLQQKQQQMGLSPTGNVAASMTNLPTKGLDETSKKVIQALGGIQGFKITEPELYQEIKSLTDQINTQEIFKSEQLKPAAQSKLTRIAKAQELLTGKPAKDVFNNIVSRQGEGKKTLLTGFLFGQQSLYLPEKYMDAYKLESQATQFSTSGQIMDFLRTAAIDILIGTLAINTAKIAFKSAPDIWNKIKYKYKHYSRDEILKIWDKVDRNIATKAEQELIKNVAKEDSIIQTLKNGFTQVEPRFGIATGKLYAGLPADEIVKAIIETGKVTADVVKGLDPVKVSQVTQQLLNTSPVLANEFLKIVETSKAEPKKPEINIPEKREILRKHGVSEDLLADEEFVRKAKIKELPPITKEEREKLVHEEVKEPETLEGMQIEKPEKKLFQPKMTKEEFVAKAKERAKEKLPKAETKEPETPVIPEKETKAVEPTKIEKPEKKIEPKVPKKLKPAEVVEKPEVKPKKAKKPEGKIEPEKPFWELEKEKPILQQETVQKSDIERIEDIKKETQKVHNRMIDERFIELKEYRSNLPPPDKGIIRDKDGRTVDRYNLSNAQDWYQDLYNNLGKKRPTNTDLKEEAIRQLKIEDENFRAMDYQIEVYDNIIDTLKEHSGEAVEVVTPKIEKEIEKLPKEVRQFLKAEEKYPEKAAKEDIKEFEKGVVKYDYQQPATKKQKIDIHKLAENKKLIYKTDTGKINDTRYRGLAKKITGKRSLIDMNIAEAEEFEAAIEGVIQRQPWQPPIIPDSTKIFEKDFFEGKQFNEPTFKKFITPKDYLLRELGAEQLKGVRDILEADKLRHIENVNISEWIKDIIKKINKELPLGQRLKSFIFNKPSEQITRMRNLLDEYIEAPEFLSDKDKAIFTELREFTRNLLDRTNKVRERLGLEPIKEVKAYIPHFLDELARQIVQKKYPFPEDVKYWLGRNMPKKIHNPTEQQRTVRDDLDKVFSKDLGKLLRALAKYDLRDIYLSEPYSILRGELKALKGQIPEETLKEINSFIKYDIFDYPTEIDKLFNNTVKVPTEIINLLLKPFGRIITNPARDISNVTRWLITRGAIAGRPKLAIRNLGQRLLTMDLYQPKYYFKAQFMPTPKWLRDMITDTTFWKLSAMGYEDIPISKITPDKLTMTPYRISHAGKDFVSNVDTAMKVGAYYAEEMVKLSQDTNSAFYKYAQRFSAEKGVPLKDLLWTKEDIRIEAEEAGSLTQWLYYKTGMPRAYRGHIARALFSLQSWFMNYFGKHIPEAITRTFTGRTSRGKLLRPIDRVNWLKGTAFIVGTLWGLRKLFKLGYERYLLPWGIALNTNFLSPLGQVITGTFNWITANSNYARKQAEWKIKSASKVFVPYFLAIDDAIKWINGEKSLKESLFYTEKEEEKKRTIPKGIENLLKPISKIKSKESLLKKKGLKSNIKDLLVPRFK